MPDGGGQVADAAQRLEHSATRRRLLTLLHRERIARTVHENGVVILAGLTGSGKSTQVLQFLLEEKEEEEEEEDDPIDGSCGGGGGGGGGGSDNPHRPPDGIWEQRRRQRLRRQWPYIVVTEP